MDASVLVIILIAIALVVVLALVASRQMRSRRLRERFGPEYERTVAEAGDRKQAESQLQERTERRQRLDIVPLDAADRDRYVEAWRQTQARFVDEPAEATREADRLITDVMRKRGYPIDDFEQRAADISVDHPQVVDDYRAAQAIAAANERSEASTEDLRQALVHYRSLFEDLLEVDRADTDRADTDRADTDRADTDRADDDRQPYDGRADTQAKEAR
jgi:hypothetical protein